MKQKTIFIGIVILLSSIFNSCKRQSDFPVLKGPYLGKSVNSLYVEKFANITPDGKYIFFISDRPVKRTYSQYFKRRKTFEEMTAHYKFHHFSRSNLTYGDVYSVDAKIIEKLKQDHLK